MLRNLQGHLGQRPPSQKHALAHTDRGTNSHGLTIRYMYMNTREVNKPGVKATRTHLFSKNEA